MSVKTAPDDLLIEMIRLILVVTGRLYDGTYDPIETEVLKEALTLFEQHRLHSVQAVGEAPTAGPKDPRELFDVLLVTLPLSTAAKEYLNKRGVRYGGELPSVIFKRISPYEPEVKRLLAQYGLSFGDSTLDLGWRPPYWDDGLFTASLDKSTTLLAGSGYFGFHSNPYGVDQALPLGEVLNRKHGGVLGIARNGNTGYMGELQLFFDRRKLPFHAGMLVPPQCQIPRQELEEVQPSMTNLGTYGIDLSSEF